MQEQYLKAHEAIKNGAKVQMAVALHTVIIGLGVRKLAVSDGLADLTGNELLSSRGRALVNREQELHIAQKVLCELLVKECRGWGHQQQCMSATQAAPAPAAVTVPTMEQKIAGAHAADIKPSQAGAVYLAMLATTPEAACTHRIADARNPVVKSGYLCVDCGAVFSAADHCDTPRQSS